MIVINHKLRNGALSVQTVSDIRTEFKRLLESKEYVVDRGGNKTIEILGASFIADEDAIFGVPSEAYIKKEIEWYDSQSTNIYDLDQDPPAAWKMTANKHGEINSNYGHLIYSEKYYNQFVNVINELAENPNSRRATMVYTRPSIWVEATENGKSDFICTNAVTYYIRDNRLDVVVQMRSNDAIFGYKNDRAWAREVQCRVCDALNHHMDRFFEDNVEPGNIYWQVQNLHVYSRHFDLV